MLDSYILDHIAEAVIYSDREGRIQRWNQGAVAMFGHDAADALGQSLDLLIPEHLRAAHWRGFDAAVKSGEMRLNGRPTVTRAVHKSGHKLYVEMSFALVRDATQATVGVVSVARDVTQRVERERQAQSQGDSA